jgi:hypothetical protein
LIDLSVVLHPNPFVNAVDGESGGLERLNRDGGGSPNVGVGDVYGGEGNVSIAGPFILRLLVDGVGMSLRNVDER